MNKILVFKEKHGHRYFDASTMRKIDAACKKILKERLEYGCYDPYLGTLPDVLPEELIAQLPEEYQKAEKEKTKTRQNILRRHKKEENFLEDVKACLEESFDGDEEALPYSFALLEGRSYREYEGMELEQLEEA